MGTLNYFFALNRGTQFSTNFLCFPGSNIFYEVDFKASPWFKATHYFIRYGHGNRQVDSHVINANEKKTKDISTTTFTKKKVPFSK